MPTTYAHYRFGRDVYKHLPKEAQTIISSHGGLYNIGLHGPDLLFYYKIYKKNPVSSAGFAMHDQPGYEFFQQAAQVMKSGTENTPPKKASPSSPRPGTPTCLDFSATLPWTAAATLMWSRWSAPQASPTARSRQSWTGI